MRASWPPRGGGGRGGDRVDQRPHLVDHALAEGQRRQHAARLLGPHGVLRVDTDQAGREQPVADGPRAQPVELDRHGIVEVVVDVVDADAEAPAQERPCRVLDERDEVVEVDERGVERPPAARGGTVRAPTRGACRARAPSRALPSKLHAWPGRGAPSSKLRASNGCSGCSTTTWPRARPLAATAVASITSSSSPIGTDGGRGAFVRSSRPPYVTTRWSPAASRASSRSWRSSLRASRSPAPRHPLDDVVAVGSAVAREHAVVEAEQAHDTVRHGAHRHERAHGDVAGAEVRARRAPLQVLGDQRLQLRQRQRPRGRGSRAGLGDEVARARGRARRAATTRAAGTP